MPLSRSDLQRLARLRVREAEVLLSQGCFEGAYYLVGYAVECGLKACIAKQTRRYDFPDKKVNSVCFTHDLGRLVEVSGLKLALQAEERANPAFATNWATVKDWSEEKRYQPVVSATAARDLVDAVTMRRNGVLAWLRKSW